MGIIATAKWPFEQAYAGLVGIKDYTVDKVTPDNILPPSVRDTVVWFSNQFPDAVGYSEPGNQVTSSIILGIATFLTGFVTGGAAWLIIGLWFVTGFIGLARFIPAVNDVWPIGPEDTPAFMNIGPDDEGQ